MTSILKTMQIQSYSQDRLPPSTVSSIFLAPWVVDEADTFELKEGDTIPQMKMNGKLRAMDTAFNGFHPRDKIR